MATNINCMEKIIPAEDASAMEKRTENEEKSLYR